MKVLLIGFVWLVTHYRFFYRPQSQLRFFHRNESKRNRKVPLFDETFSSYDDAWYVHQLKNKTKRKRKFAACDRSLKLSLYLTFLCLLLESHSWCPAIQHFPMFRRFLHQMDGPSLQLAQGQPELRWSVSSS